MTRRSPMHTLRSPVTALALAALVLAWLPAAPAAAQAQGDAAQRAADAPDVHPFYIQLLEEGIYTYHQGDASGAATELRLAVFGLLDAPELLSKGLAYLALAQEQAGDAEAARGTLGRLIAVEDRFATWHDLDLTPAVRQQTEELLMAAVPEEMLAASPGFRGLADERFLRRIAEMTPAERIAALGQQVEQRPGEPRWLVALATAELDAGDSREAARHADELLSDDSGAGRPHHPTAHCILGIAAARNDDCATVVEHLEACPRSRQEEAVAVELLACRVKLRQWPAARQLLGELPPTLRDRRPVARLARKVDRAAPVPEPPAEPPQEGAEEASASGLPDADATRLEEARQLLAQARRASELEEPLRIAREVADANPESSQAQHLAGEIAYRASRWEMAADYYRRGGEPQRSEQRFYMAVALFESGDRQAAADVLESALPDLPRNPFVTSYVERILGEGNASGVENR